MSLGRDATNWMKRRNSMKALRETDELTIRTELVGGMGKGTVEALG